MLYALSWDYFFCCCFVSEIVMDNNKNNNNNNNNNIPKRRRRVMYMRVESADGNVEHERKHIQTLEVFYNKIDVAIRYVKCL